jgi:cytochrome c biogenesis protein CcmG/thiol:disulfide interchange protein DsbE
MNPYNDNSINHEHPQITKRGVILGIASLVPMVLLLSLLTCSIVRSGGNPKAFGVISEFGVVDIGNVQAPEFVATTLDGSKLRLSEKHGQIVMIDFWSTWCPPCRQEAPALSQVYNEYRDKGVLFIGIAVWDDMDKLEHFVEEFQIAYPIALDTHGEIAMDYGVPGIPEKYFVNKNGQLERKLIGPTSPDTLRAVLDDLLKD